MTYLSENAARVMAHLEEAGSENISSTLNTILDVSGAVEEVLAIQSAIAELIQFDLVRIAIPKMQGAQLAFQDKVTSLEFIQHLGDQIVFSLSEGIWKWQTQYPRAEITALSKGIAEARLLLDERGYEWWRRPEESTG